MTIIITVAVVVAVGSEFEFDFEFLRGDFGFGEIVIVEVGFRFCKQGHLFALEGTLGFFPSFFSFLLITLTIAFLACLFPVFRRFVLFGDGGGREVSLGHGTFLHPGETHVGALEITNRGKMFPIMIA
jgi:hypothetical protein